MHDSRPFLRSPSAFLGALVAPFLVTGACSAVGNHVFTVSGAGGDTSAAHSAGAGGLTGSSHATSGGGLNGFDAGHLNDSGGCTEGCSSDLHSVIDCMGNVIQTCSGSQGCDHATLSCKDACQATVDNKLAIGCEYYATFMDQDEPDVCFAAFVANTWNTPVHINVDFAGTPLPVDSFTFIPSGTGPSLTYGPYNSTTGLMPGEVAILFLAGGSGLSSVPCPSQVAQTAMPTGAQILNATDIGNSFHITTDVPVVAYEMNPYGGGSAAVTAGSLLLPTSVWDTNYLAVTVTPFDLYGPSMNIIAAEDGTQVTMLPSVAVQGGGSLPPGPPNVQYTFTLNKGQQAQFTQMEDLTGTIIQATKPIGFMAGQPCMRYPIGVAYCDHGEQMVPPIKALGNEYVGVQFRPRVTGNGNHDQASWHIVGVVDTTTLTYVPSPPPGAPLVLNGGQVVDFTTDQPFVVQSQDGKHPFMMFTYMTGSQDPSVNNPPNSLGYGDPDFVLSVPPQQYNNDYVFFTDPTYPETNLVIVRAKDQTGNFDDVTLDCAGTLTGWQPVGNYEWTRVDLETGNFQPVGGCSNGAHEIKSKGPFGLWVWGWGTPNTSQFTANVSYGYPGGMSVTPINTVVVPPMPK